jgi:hypothetical protein
LRCIVLIIFEINVEVDVHGLLKEVDSEANVEVTDDDMNDPDLLAELNEIAEPGNYFSLFSFLESYPKNKRSIIDHGDGLKEKKALNSYFVILAFLLDSIKESARRSKQPQQKT